MIKNNFNIGSIPIRQDITVIPADKNKSLIGWTVTIKEGCEVFKPYDNWVTKFGKKLAKDGFYGDLIFKHRITDIKGLKIGDTIIVGTLYGLDEAVVSELDYEKKEGMAENEHNLYPLVFGNDDRNAWICSGAINKKCLELPWKIKID